MADPIDVGDFGKFSIAADASAPLLIVFGGIVVGGEISGVYMWHYMQPIQDRYHIFVAHDNTVNGTRSLSPFPRTRTKPPRKSMFS